MTLHCMNKPMMQLLILPKNFRRQPGVMAINDLSYLWHRLESGYSSMAAYTVQRKLLDLRDTLPENNPICYVQKIDNVLFSHAGVLDYFAEGVVPKAKYHDVDCSGGGS